MTNGKIRVLFAMLQMGMGGSERLIYNLVRNIDRRAFEPSIAWFFQEEPLKEFRDLAVPLHFVRKRRRLDLAAMRQFSTIVREQQIDVVNAHHFMPFVYAFYGTKLAGRARLVYTEHSEADVLAAGGRWRTIGRALLRRSDAAVGVSDKVSATLRSHFDIPSAMVQTIENGVDVDLFGAGSPLRERLRQQLGFSPRDRIVGHVANFRRNKNHMFLLRAFREVVKQRPEAKLVFIGHGTPGDPENSEPDVVRFIESEGLGGSVRLLGYRSNVQELLQILDVVCLVSYKEGLPLSLIEAMASALPVVGTNIEGIRGVVQEQVNGLLVPPDDVPALAAALERLLSADSLRLQMGHASRQLATEKYALSRCLNQTESLFRELVAGRSQPSPQVSQPGERAVSSSKP